MKLLFDQNISYRLVKKLDSVFPGCQHVNRLGLINKSDREIWDFARKQGYTLVLPHMIHLTAAARAQQRSRKISRPQHVETAS